MLSITRHIGESIVIDTGSDKIEISIKEIRGKIARVTIDADRKFLILRKELLDGKQKKEFRNG